MVLRGILVAAGLTVTMAMTACSGRGDTPPNTNPAIPASPLTTAVSTSPTPAAVPIDQIPPGNPTEWVPAGVPTTAKYMEPGDVVPKFTRDMFTRTQGGALDTAHFFLDVENWGTALVNRRPELVICDWSQCKEEVDLTAKIGAEGHHFSGARTTASPPKIFPAPASTGADWVVQTRLATSAGNVLDDNGAVVAKSPASSELVNIYLKWNGKMWRVTGKYTVQ